ncbi:unnamed protein product [Rotaria socialis]|nr:unnamed protein product [Rotaria socialis]CAF4889290.1 unnamed protein product [Rotaria socialis]
MRDRLHLNVDIGHMSLCNIGPGNLDFLLNPNLYESLQDVVLRQYQGDQWKGYYYVTPIFVPNLPWDIVLGSNHFYRLGVEWNSEMKQLVPLTTQRPIFRPRVFPSRYEIRTTQDFLRQLL